MRWWGCPGRGCPRGWWRSGRCRQLNIPAVIQYTFVQILLSPRVYFKYCIQGRFFSFLLLTIDNKNVFMFREFFTDDASSKAKERFPTSCMWRSWTFMYQEGPGLGSDLIFLKVSKVKVHFYSYFRTRLLVWGPYWVHCHCFHTRKTRLNCCKLLIGFADIL